MSIIKGKISYPKLVPKYIQYDPFGEEPPWPYYDCPKCGKPVHMDTNEHANVVPLSKWLKEPSPIDDCERADRNGKRWIEACKEVERLELENRELRKRLGETNAPN